MACDEGEPGKTGQAVGRVCVVVLGDIGRSPRMTYHSLSMAKRGFQVAMVGYDGSRPPTELLMNGYINVHHLPRPPVIGWTVIDLPLKLLWQTNPPALPALAICLFIAKLKRMKLIIDWHNYTWSMFQQRWGHSNLFIQMIEKYEYYLAQWADFHICVTEAMGRDLEKRGLKMVTTFHDRPYSSFESMTVDQQHDFLSRIASSYPEFQSNDTLEDEGAIEATRYTIKKADGYCQKRSDRPCLLLTSTSWTPDEDFQLLLDALLMYSNYAEECDKEKLPSLCVVITGKGPLKGQFLHIISDMDFKNRITIITPWLEAADYPRMIACADLGISLHTSTSGLDLPMKVVDMFGCHLPVVALEFKALDELLLDSVNGLTFQDAQQLAECLRYLLTGFPDYCSKLDAMRRRLEKEPLKGWDESWELTAWPVLEQAVSS